MTIDCSEIQFGKAPLYQAIADHLMKEIASGNAPPGFRLPPQRELARQLRVTIGTVSRAYRELERRGQVRGEVGRGTFVCGDESDELMRPLEDPDGGVIDLARNFPPPRARRTDFARVLRELADARSAALLLDYQDHAGRLEHRQAGADWLQRGGFQVSPERVLVTSGAQHGLLVALSIAGLPGDQVALASLGFPGAKAAAQLLGRKVQSLAMDEEGVTADAVEAACSSGARILCCVPTLQNPTNAVMSISRRRAIAEIVQRHDATFVEDDLFGLMLPQPLPPISAFAPEHCIYLTSLSKTLAPGLRVGYLVAPDRLRQQACSAIRTTCWMAPPITADVATRWIQDGTAARMLADQREEAAARMALATDILKPFGARGVDGAFHLWFRPPENWSATSLVEAAGEHGVLLTTDLPFVFPGAASSGRLRICLGTPATRQSLERGLRTLASLLRADPTPPTELSIV